MQIRKKNKLIRIIGYSLLFCIFLQIILGAWVRLTGSGMSCPDWPLCYGYIFPTPGKIHSLGSIGFTYFQVFLEWIHRANAAFVIGPLCIFFSIYILYKKNIFTEYSKLSYLLLILIITQGALGGLTVFKSNIPWSVAIHLIFAFLLYLTVLLIICKTYNFNKFSVTTSKFTKINTAYAGVLTMMAAAAGAFTSKYGASLSCNSWPGCNDNFFPNLNDMFELIHFGHRVIAFFLLIALTILFFKITLYFKILSKRVKYLSGLIFIVITFQIIIGALLIYYSIPVWLGIFHQATGLMLFSLISLLYLHMKLEE